MVESVLTRNRLRWSALALGLSAFLFAIFPLVRPYFPMDPTQPAATLAGAASAVTSAAWMLAHALATIAFVLLLCGLPALYASLSEGAGEPAALRALVLSGTGVAFVLPTLGVELYALPAIGRIYLRGVDEIAPVINFIYIGAATAVMLVGLLLLAIGAITFAVVIWRTAVLPKWAGIAFGVGLALWLPLLPPPVRIVDGLLIGAGGLWLAWEIGRGTKLGL